MACKLEEPMLFFGDLMRRSVTKFFGLESVECLEDDV